MRNGKKSKCWDFSESFSKYAMFDGRFQFQCAAGPRICQKGPGGQNISVSKSPPNTDRRVQNLDGERVTLLQEYQSNQGHTFLDIKKWAESHTNTYMLGFIIVLGVVLAFLALINTTFGIFGRWTMTVNTVHGRCLTVILIQKYLYHQTGFCAFEVPPRIAIGTVRQTRCTLKKNLKNPNILIYFQLFFRSVHFR